MILEKAKKTLQKKIGDIFRVELLLLLFAIAMALVTFGESVYTSFMSLFLRDFGIPVVQIGFFFTVFYAANALIAIPAGYISDRVGRKIIVVFLLILSGIVVSYPLVKTTGQLYLLRIAHGAVFAFIFPVARAYVMDKTSETNRGQTMGTYVLFCSIASMIAPLTGGIIRDQIGNFNPLFYIAAAFPLISILLLLISVRDLGKGFTLQKMSLPTRELVKNKVFAVILLMFTMLFFANGILTPIMSIFAFEELGMSYTMLGLLGTFMGVIYAVSQFVAGTLSDHYGRKTLLVYPLFIYALGVALAGLSVTPSMFFLSYMLVGIGAAPYATVAYSYIGDVVHSERRGIAVGTVSSLSSIGMIFGPMIGSALGGFAGLRIPFFATSGMVLLTILMLSLLLPKGTEVKE
ncbi:MAG: MFS transporter [Theionarchaea archaeon]|nr:MFS transporter [Theionarchaea archaeon]